MTFLLLYTVIWGLILRWCRRQEDIIFAGSVPEYGDLKFQTTWAIGWLSLCGLISVVWAIEGLLGLQIGPTVINFLMMASALYLTGRLIRLRLLVKFS